MEKRRLVLGDKVACFRCSDSSSARLLACTPACLQSAYNFDWRDTSLEHQQRQTDQLCREKEDSRHIEWIANLLVQRRRSASGGILAGLSRPSKGRMSPLTDKINKTIMASEDVSAYQ